MRKRVRAVRSAGVVSSLLLSGCCAVGAFAAAEARAEIPRSFDWLRAYHVPAECPSEQAFRQGMTARIGRGPAEAFARLRIEVEVTRGPTALAGTLRVHDDSARLLAKRQVDGAACGAVLEALSLIAALSADAAPPGPAVVPQSAAPAEPRDLGASTAAASERDFSVGLAALALVDSSAAPGAATGLGVGLELEWKGDGPWRPWLQLAGSRLESHAGLDGGQIRARYGVSSLAASACPVRVLGGSAWALRPCLSLEAGSISGAGSGPAVTKSFERRALWLSSGLSLRGSVTLWGPLQAATTVGAILPWARHEFFLAPDTLVFAIPGLGWRATGSLAATF